MLLCRLYPNNYFIHANIEAINENNYQYTLICSISTSHRTDNKFVCFHLPQNIFNWNLRAPAHSLMKSNTAANLTAHVYVSKKSLATTAKTIWICWGKFMSCRSSFDNKKTMHFRQIFELVWYSRVRMELFDRCSNANILNPHNYSDTPLCPSSSSQTAIELPQETDRALQLCFDPNCTRKSMQRR